MAQNKDCKIQYLNLEDNQLGNEGIKILLRGLISNIKLKILNISKNQLTDEITEDF